MACSSLRTRSSLGARLVVADGHGLFEGSFERRSGRLGLSSVARAAGDQATIARYALPIERGIAAHLAQIRLAVALPFLTDSPSHRDRNWNAATPSLGTR